MKQISAKTRVRGSRSGPSQAYPKDAAPIPFIGTAGWSIRAEHRDEFPSAGSQLERYAARFNAVEINSSFYRPRRRATYERWSAAVGVDFRFSVKLPKTVSHARDRDTWQAEVARFIEEVTGLGDKLGIVLAQFPPSAAFDEVYHVQLFKTLNEGLSCPIVCEPRHGGWFGNDADALLDRLGVARVAADPAVVSGADIPGGWTGLRYHRLHGSPKIYYSGYETDALKSIRDILAKEAAASLETWCILDNTALEFATANALWLREELAGVPMERPCDPRIGRR